jgi:adrenodoxin-NADP+ reductase
LYRYITVDPEELVLEPEDEADLADQRPRRRALEAITKAVAAPPATGASPDPEERELVLKFLRSPVEFLPAAAAGEGGEDRVGSVRLSVNALEGPSGSRKAISTVELYKLNPVYP